MNEAPDFINPPRLVDLSPEDAQSFLEGIRMRRLVAVHYYQEVQAEREKNRRAELDRKFEVLESRLLSCINKIDEQLEKAEGYFGKLSHLKLESM